MRRTVEEADAWSKSTELGRLMDSVARKYSLKAWQLLRPDRRHHLVHARYEAYWMAYHVLGKKFLRIAKEYERDHTTIMYGVAKHEARRQKLLALQRGNEHDRQAVAI